MERLNHLTFVDIILQVLFLLTYTSTAFELIPLKVATFFCLPKAVVASNIKIEKILNKAKYQYSSRSHKLAQKNWNTGMGPILKKIETYK